MGDLPVWEQKARERVSENLATVKAELRGLIREGANESKTRLVIDGMLRDVLGWPIGDIGTEFAVQSDWADYALSINGEVKALVEVKGSTVKLAMRHLDQVDKYARRHGAEWMVLTNGQHWQLHHADATTPQTITTVISIDLLDGRHTSSQVDEMLFFSRDAMKRNLAQAQWRRCHATDSRVLSSAILSPTVLNAIRVYVRKESGYKASDDELRKAIREGVFEPKILA